jgi:hypothetical protein
MAGISPAMTGLAARAVRQQQGRLVLIHCRHTTGRSDRNGRRNPRQLAGRGSAWGSQAIALGAQHSHIY